MNQTEKEKLIKSCEKVNKAMKQTADNVQKTMKPFNDALIRLAEKYRVAIKKGK